ncbi:MAG: bifunctional tRNA (5-methylaminomethyl-2-thiouridine)(34)-methyltransferase MnmD/FAD-dependent 5-carboxymethylaminomethyl-2-thiouridine(34) oxidoreductase MnmC [Wenzhouxiangellaceae bacterium]|nr:bifunctional tRNA (5-methylaminomethyl-2-thiouridine)(34)-methyltransferase MnmD/FAD-dependent 5-carboxymethylaminomethyl-2-thiouridine(34) oxidoreductase MnmC [Wenzhouxiangellaceae bacterium]
MQPDFDPVTTARVAWDGGNLISPAFGDGYFSRQGGPAESQAVFIEGNHLVRRFDSLDSHDLFVIGETGSGTGLNLLLAARLFAERAPANARLALISAEKHPLSKSDLERALGLWPELAPFSTRLLAGYPPPTPGFHRLHLADNIDLTLMFGDALDMWQQQRARVDAWFLDGFAPDRNPALWQPRLFSRIARLSGPGTTLATFTAAGAVRSGLAEVGFRIERKPGFGRKRHRLEGSVPGAWKARKVRTGAALVVGAGLAGATTARALAERGWRVRVVDAGGIACGASGNRSGVVYTSPSGKATPQNRFYQSSYLHALGWLRRMDAEGCGIGRFNDVVQHITSARQKAKLDQALGSGHWPSSLLQRHDEFSVLMHGAGYLQPRKWCQLLLDHPGIELRQHEIISVAEDLPMLETAGGCHLEADCIVLATAAAVNRMDGVDALPLNTLRGQVTECRATAASRQWARARCTSGYVTPAIDGIHCVGASFDPRGTDQQPIDADDVANLEMLGKWLPRHWQELGGANIEVTGRRVGFRCQTRDFLPAAGPAGGVNDDRQLMFNIGHGSRGIAGTPLIADLLVDYLSQTPLPVDEAIRSALDPQRFAARRAKSRPFSAFPAP